MPGLHENLQNFPHPGLSIPKLHSNRDMILGYCKGSLCERQQSVSALLGNWSPSMGSDRKYSGKIRGSLDSLKRKSLCVFNLIKCTFIVISYGSYEK